MSKLILFVCTGNTCRSPMAEYYFNHKSSGDFKAVSRGIYAEANNLMAANAQQVLLDNNIIVSLSEILHKSAQIDEKIIDEAMLIYGITENHANILRASFPDYAGKILSMPNIGDPYGGGLEIYAACFENIRGAVDSIIEDLACAR